MLVVSAFVLAVPFVFVQDLQGRAHNPFSGGPSGSKVFLFISRDCPISNGYMPEWNRIVTRFRSANVSFASIYEDPVVSGQLLRAHVKSFHVQSTPFWDMNHLFAKRLGATVTPEAVLTDNKGKVFYRGRIDDSYLTLGHHRPNVTRHDLIDAISATLQSRPVAVKQTQAVGCTINFAVNR